MKYSTCPAGGKLIHLADGRRLTRSQPPAARRLQPLRARLYSGPMAPFPRYAIYHAAARGGKLDRLGAHLLGYDAWTGEEMPFPDGVARAVPDWRDLTQDPGKYGFHATLKAPMALAHRQDRGRASRCMRMLRRNAATCFRHHAYRQLDQRLHRGGSGSTVGRA